MRSKRILHNASRTSLAKFSLNGTFEKVIVKRGECMWDPVSWERYGGFGIITERTQTSEGWVARVFIAKKSDIGIVETVSRPSLIFVPDPQGDWNPEKWSHVSSESCGRFETVTERMRTPAGWIVRVFTDKESDIGTVESISRPSLVFVPDPQGDWILEKKKK